MKKILVLIFIAASLNAIGQRPYTEVVRSLGKFDSLMVSGTRVTAISVDSTTTYGSNSKLITERAAKAYARTLGGTNIYNTDGYLTGSRILKGGGVYSLTFDSLTHFYVNRNAINRILVTPTQTLLASQNNGAYLSMGGSSSTLQTSGVNTIKSDDGASESNIVINAGSIEIKPDEGVLVIDSLASSSSPTHLLTWISTAGANRGKTQALAIGTGVATALGINVGSAGAVLTYNGAGGTPSAINLSNGTSFPYATGGTGLLPIANGGLNNNASPTNGYVLVGDGSKYVPTAVLVTASGQYDPSGNNEANLDSWTMSTLQYLRVGDRVTVSGIIEMKATSAATTTSLDIELPFATSFDNDAQAGGTGWSSEVAGGGFAVTSIGSGDKVKIAFVSVDTSTHIYSFSFTYKVI